MNIKEAKDEIRSAVFAYFTKNEFGEYEIPIERQRPLFLMGPPGIGKTAIMEQIAQELKVGLVSYSMSHHTRQSALGLPLITTKVYNGKEYKVAEYTMSEIIASVFDMIDETGFKEGILFLDEINCVSETLAPAMLQFLQYKTFGRHQVPYGWIVVTAGNPPEYNNSVREFDVVTWDRLKRIDITPDCAPWKEYAVNIGVHPAITTYLDIRKDDFYRVESTADGKNFVTARSWVDLSSMIRIYERRGFKITRQFVVQYLQDERIASDFAQYYDTFNKYKEDYNTERILSGDFEGDIRTRAKQAGSDERISILGLLIDELSAQLRNVCMEEDALAELVPHFKNVRLALDGGSLCSDALDIETAGVNAHIETGKRASVLSVDRHHVLNRVIAILAEEKEKADDFAGIKADFDELVASLKSMALSARERMSNLFRFCELMFGVDSNGDSREMIILVAALTTNNSAARFIARYGCDEYFAHDHKLLFDERQKELSAQIASLEL